MQKRHIIHWRKSDKVKLNNAITEYNRKIRHVNATDPHLAQYQPKIIDAAERKRITETLEFSTRETFNKTIASLNRYTKNEHAENVTTSKSGLKLTVYERAETYIQKRRINRERQKELKRLNELELKSRGIPVGVKKGEMGSVKRNELKPKQFNPDKIKPGKEWEMFKQSLAHQLSESYQNEKLEQMRENYITGLINVFGVHETTMRGVPELIEIIRGIDVKKFYETVLTDEQASFSFIYDPLEAAAKFDAIFDTWLAVDSGL